MKSVKGLCRVNFLAVPPCPVVGAPLKGGISRARSLPLLTRASSCVLTLSRKMWENTRAPLPMGAIE